MKALRNDPWLQLFAVLAAFAAGILIYEQGKRGARAAAEAATSAASAAVAAPAQAAQQLTGQALDGALRAAAANASPDPVAPSLPPAAAPSPAPAAPAAPPPAPKLTVTPPPAQPSGGLFGGMFGGQLQAPVPRHKHLGRPKKPGEWVVDEKNGPDADSTSLADVLYSAEDGDLVVLRPGAYAEMDLGGAKRLVVRGAGAKPEDVRVAVGTTWHVSGGVLRLQNISLEKTPDPAGAEPNGAALFVSGGGEARLKDVRLSVKGVTGSALRVSDGVVLMSGGQLEGTRADAMLRGKAIGNFVGVTFRHDLSPVIAWNGAKATLRDCRMPRLSKRGAARAYEGGTVAGAGRVDGKRSRADRAADGQAFGTSAAPSLAGQPDPSDPLSALYQIIPMVQPGAQAQPVGPRRAQFRKDIFRPGRKAGDIND